MSDLAEKNKLIKELVREKYQLKRQLMTARRTLEQQAKKRLEAENTLKEYKSAEKSALNPVVMKAYVGQIRTELNASLKLNDSLRDQRDQWISKYNNDKEPYFDFNYLMRVCEAIAK